MHVPAGTAEAMLAVYADCRALQNTGKKRPQKLLGRGEADISNSCFISLGPSHGRAPPGVDTCSQPSLGKSISVWRQHGEPVFRGLGRAWGFDAEANWKYLEANTSTGWSLKKRK